MSFRNPSFLWLLLALIAPILLYLLYLPRRRVLSSTFFLWEKFLQAERFGKVSERFRRALGFALWCAIFSALILAGSDPTIGTASITASRLVILIDTSASMNATVDGQSNLERARQAAAALIDTLDSTTQTALVEANHDLDQLAGFSAPGPALARKALAVQPFDGTGELTGLLQKAWHIWGQAREGEAPAELYVFSDKPLPPNPWGSRAHLWRAPKAKANVAITALKVERQGRKVLGRYTLANYGPAPCSLTGEIQLNSVARDKIQALALAAGQSLEGSFELEESGAAALQIKIEALADDALAADNTARAIVPAQSDRRVCVVWPKEGKRDTYIHSLLAVMKEQGFCEPSSDADGTQKATLYAYSLPQAWPPGGAIVLYPLNSSPLVRIAGLNSQALSIDRQASHPLLEDVDLIGMRFAGTLNVQLPAWAQPLVWADSQPLIWAGETDKTKVVFIGIPIQPSGSRLPFTVAFPTLLQNAMKWMLPVARSCQPGERQQGWTSRQIGFVENPVSGEVQAFSLLDAGESDLRREDAEASGPPQGRQSLAGLLVALALCLLPLEWALFHKRVTE